MDFSQEPLLGEHGSQENMPWQTEANIESQADSGAQPDELNEEDEDAVMTYYKSLGLGGAEAEQELGGSRSQRKAVLNHSNSAGSAPLNPLLKKSSSPSA